MNIIWLSDSIQDMACGARRTHKLKWITLVMGSTSNEDQKMVLTSLTKEFTYKMKNLQ